MAPICENKEATAMRLYLVQHGEALAKEVDPERPLSDRGSADVRRLATMLAGAGVRVERVIHSGRRRAAQTAEILAEAMAPGVALEESGLINPNDNPKAFDWQSGSWDRDTLIVGHLPFMARLVAHLLIDDEDRAITAFRPGSIVCLESDDDGRWWLAWMLRPELLGR
jgi:phosphohistidine phosphatase